MAAIKDEGMVTAEYATGMVGAVIIAMLLYRFGTDGTFYDLLKGVLEKVRDTLGIFDLGRGWRRPWLM
ncbi:MAG: DUF4244 domain-containing protein [Propionibacteriales bacterium]|nr:DUF4244 domain-containing protein [Propionibacteriales bacterium]HZW45448.1 DUF4244 domain-containing protein [Dermatophilaceae bacterium]